MITAYTIFVDFVTRSSGQQGQLPGKAAESAFECDTCIIVFRDIGHLEVLIGWGLRFEHADVEAAAGMHQPTTLQCACISQ